MRLAKASGIVVVLVGLVGCGQMSKAVKDAKAATDQFFQTRMAGGDMQKTLACYTPQFFEAAGGQDKWQGELEAVGRYYGPVKSWSYQFDYHWEKNTAGEQVKLTADVVCEKGAAVEAFTLLKAPGDNSPWLILAHHIQPKNAAAQTPATRPAN